MYANRVAVLRRCVQHAGWARKVFLCLSREDTGCFRIYQYSNVVSVPSRRSFCLCNRAAQPSYHARPETSFDHAYQTIISLIHKKPWTAATETDLQRFVPISSELLQNVLSLGLDPNTAAKFLSWAVARGGCEPHSDTVMQVAALWAEKYGSERLSALAQHVYDNNDVFCEAVWVALMVAFNSLKQSSDAVSIFKRFVKCGNRPTDLSGNALLSSLLKDERCDAALLVARKMIASKTVPDPRLLGLLFDFMIKHGKQTELYAKAKEVYALVDNIGKLGDKRCYEWAYSRFISSAARGLRPANTVINYLKDMRNRGLTPDMQAYKSCIKILCREHKLEAAQGLFIEMQEKSHVPDDVTYLALVDGFYFSGKPLEAQQVFELMLSQGCTLDAKVYNAKIRCLFGVKQADKAMETLDEMIKAGFEPSLATYSVVVENLCNIGDVNHAKEIMKRMSETGIEPSAKMYLWLAENLSSSCQFEELMQLASDMKGKGLLPNAVIYNSVVTYHLVKRNHNEALIWAKEMSKNDIRPTPYIHAKLACVFGDTLPESNTLD